MHAVPLLILFLAAVLAILAFVGPRPFTTSREPHNGAASARQRGTAFGVHRIGFVFLGTWVDSTGKIADLYVWPQRPAVLAQYSSAVFDFDLGFLLVGKKPAVTEAYKRAVARGFIKDVNRIALERNLVVPNALSLDERATEDSTAYWQAIARLEPGPVR